jgi:hypothetical protein
MIPVQPESRSLVLRSANILVFRILEAAAGEPSAAPGRPQSQTWNLKIQLLDVLKGEIEEKPGAVVTAQIVQYLPSPGRQGAPTGVWAARDIAPGQELISFGRIPVKNLAAAILDEACEQIEDAKDALADVTLSIKAEQSGRPALAILGYAATVPDQIGYLFAEYACAKTMDTTLPDPATFDAFMKVLEAPKLRLTAREAMLDEAFAKVIDSDEPPPEITNRFALGLFRLLVAEGIEELRPKLLEDYLPHILRLEERGRTLKAQSVFAGHSAEASTVERWLAQNPGAPNSARLRTWIRSR